MYIRPAIYIMYSMLLLYLVGEDTGELAGYLSEQDGTRNGFAQESL
jgi:hypothetical protein